MRQKKSSSVLPKRITRAIHAKEELGKNFILLIKRQLERMKLALKMNILKIIYIYIYIIELINGIHCQVGWGCRIQRLFLCRAVRPQN